MYGRASAAYVDITKARTTQRRFPVNFGDLPSILLVSKKHYYRYTLEMN